MYARTHAHTHMHTAPKEPKLLDITYSVGVEKLDEQEKEV